MGGDRSRFKAVFGLVNLSVRHKFLLLIRLAEAGCEEARKDSPFSCAARLMG